MGFHYILNPPSILFSFSEAKGILGGYDPSFQFIKGLNLTYIKYSVLFMGHSQTMQTQIRIITACVQNDLLKFVTHENETPNNSKTGNRLVLLILKEMHFHSA